MDLGMDWGDVQMCQTDVASKSAQSMGPVASMRVGMMTADA